ncbi:MAG: hypothetical protein II244_07080, partial [Clostridia bacterium]|nr:hypothetical protein [Clostridia bacterium]
MSIQTAIENAQQKVANAYTAVNNKGGTLPATQDLSNLPTAINTISTAGTVETLNVTPTTSAQQFIPSGGVDGYNPVNVSAVTSNIDASITAGNIKSGVSILGVNGSVVELNGETRNVSLTNANGQTFTPSSNKNAITSITITPNNQNRTVTPTTNQQTLTVNSGYSGNGTVTVDAVTSAIDSSIQPENIKKDVVILGTTGSYEGAGANIDSLNVTPTTSAQTITASGGVDGYSPVNVSAVTSSIDPNIVPNKIRNGCVILGVTGTYGEPLPRGIILTSGISGYLVDGDFYLCGRNNYGQQGTGDTTNVTTFRKVAENVAQIVLTQYSSGYLTTTGDFYLCGWNNAGQQGTGDTTNVTTFRKVAENVAQVFLSNFTSGYITTTGDFYLCGANDAGQQGNGTSGSATNVTTFTKRGENVAQIFLSKDTSGYLTTTGDFYLCGWNNAG